MVRGPTDQQRTVIVGRTGSGKSQFACDMLSVQNWADDDVSQYDPMPWVIIDYKGEDLLRDVIKATGGFKWGAVKMLDVLDDPPTEPGLYYMNPRPKVDDAAMDAFLWKCHQMKRGGFGRRYRGHIGLFIDEGYCLPQSHGSAFDIILTQGRSLYIPVIVLYQRPVWMSRFAVAQSDFRACFALDDERDMKTAASFIKPVRGPNGEIINVFSELPRFYCLWYDVGAGSSSLLRPASDRTAIIGTFKRRLSPQTKRALI